MPLDAHYFSTPMLLFPQLWLITLRLETVQPWSCTNVEIVQNMSSGKKKSIVCRSTGSNQNISCSLQLSSTVVKKMDVMFLFSFFFNSNLQFNFLSKYIQQHFSWNSLIENYAQTQSATTLGSDCVYMFIFYNSLSSLSFCVMVFFSDLKFFYSTLITFM